MEVNKQTKNRHVLEVKSLLKHTCWLPIITHFWGWRVNYTFCWWKFTCYLELKIKHCHCQEPC